MRAGDEEELSSGLLPQTVAAREPASPPDGGTGVEINFQQLVSKIPNQVIVWGMITFSMVFGIFFLIVSVWAFFMFFIPGGLAVAIVLQHRLHQRLFEADDSVSLPFSGAWLQRLKPYILSLDNERRSVPLMLILAISPSGVTVCQSCINTLLSFLVNIPAFFYGLITSTILLHVVSRKLVTTSHLMAATSTSLESREALILKCFIVVLTGGGCGLATFGLMTTHGLDLPFVTFNAFFLLGWLALGSLAGLCHVFCLVRQQPWYRRMLMVGVPEPKQEV